MDQATRDSIVSGETFLGIELGSTRIKVVLIDGRYAPVAAGGHEWENRLENGVWTYHLEDVWAGVQDSYRNLADEVRRRYGVELTRVGAIGISAMMHGYMAFDGGGNLLTPFRTWRNTTTERAAAALTEAFRFNIPQRWSAAHFYQAILDGEPHVGDVRFLTTLAGYVHWRLTGERVLGVGEASGMFPIDSASCRYDAEMLRSFDALAAGNGQASRLEELLPGVLRAGEAAGSLTPEGARRLDPTGRLQPGIPLCPPEGDAGTGMAATNSVAARTGNVSAGTSIFAMAVLERPLSKVYAEIDMVTTPDGKPVAMVHCNNCTSDLDAWVRLFGELHELLGGSAEKSALYDALCAKALEGDPDCGGLLACNYVSGEPVTGFAQGRPLFTRLPDSRFQLANFMRAQLFACMATLKIGMEILTEKEGVRLERMLGHGGLFKTRDVGQRLMAAALNVPVAVMESAGEGGAWGIAVLAAYSGRKRPGETLEAFLAERVFAGNAGSSVAPDPADARGFAAYLERYVHGLAIERAAVEHLK